MTGIAGAWTKIVSNIKALSNFTYVTVGIVFTEETKDVNIVKLKRHFKELAESLQASYFEE